MDNNTHTTSHSHSHQGDNQTQQPSLSQTDLEAISQKFSVPFDVPIQKPITPTDQHPYLLIRHAFSEQNLQELELFRSRPDFKWDNATMEDAKLFINEWTIDSPLHDIGISQCLSQTNVLNDIEFHIVYVSPLRRAIQTTIYMFSTHPNRKNIRFVLLPELSECLCASGCFSPHTLSSVKKQMDQLAKKFDVHLDYSLVEQLGECWQILTLADDHVKQRIMDKVMKESEDNNPSTVSAKYLQTVLDELRKANNFHIEDTLMLTKKAQKAKKFLLQEYQKICGNDKNQAANSKTHKNAKIGVVSHAYLLKCLTAKHIDEKGQPQNGIFLANAQAAPFQFI